MGKKLSRVIGRTPEYPVSDQMQELFESLGFTIKDMNHIYHLFLAINVDRSGAINVHEFLDYFELTRSEFTKKTFKLMDKDDSGRVDFEEFVLSLWNFCSFTQESLIRYAFSLYDSDGSGEIDMDEAEHFVSEMWGEKWHTNRNAEAIMGKLHAISLGNDGLIPIGNFVGFAHDHPLLMFPAFQIQHDMVEKILGERFWTKVADHRLKIERSDGKFKTIDDILQAFDANHSVLRKVKETESDFSQRSQRYSFAESFRHKVVALSKRRSITKFKAPPEPIPEKAKNAPARSSPQPTPKRLKGKKTHPT